MDCFRSLYTFSEGGISFLLWKLDNRLPMRYNIRKIEYMNIFSKCEGGKKMEREREEQLYRLQAELCQVLAEPTRLKLLTLLGERPRAVKELVEATGERQAKISQHLAIMRLRGIVRAERAGTEVRYSLVDSRILEACRITREVLIQQLMQQGNLATPLVGAEGCDHASL